MERQIYQEKILRYAAEHHYEDMSGHTPFKIIFHLTSAYAGHDRVHLDALIQYCVVLDALQGTPLPPSNTPYDIPLPLEIVWQYEGNRLYHSTSLLPCGKEKKGVYYWTKRNDPMASRFARRKMNGQAWQPDNGSGTYREYLTPLPTRNTKALRGYGVGDSAEIERLLALLSVIGKKTSMGLGQISHIEVVPYEPSLRYLFIQDEQLLRPVPREALSALGYQPTESTTMLQLGYTPPYWMGVHQGMCYPEGTRVTQAEAATITLSAQRRSIADFLIFCERGEALFRTQRYLPVNITLTHPKLQQGRGQGTLCALSGLPISEEGAVAARDVLKGEMGNVVDFLKAPHSPWVSHTSALVLSQQRMFHRSFVALISPDEQEARLIFPTVAVDPTNPQQERPLWREVLLDLAEKYLNFHCLIICKDEPKSRWWPRMREGVVGMHTPLFFVDAELSIADRITISVIEAKRQMLLIESLLDAGYGRTAIRTGSLRAEADLQEALLIQKELEAMQQTPEFLFAWRIARSKQEREKRKGTH